MSDLLPIPEGARMDPAGPPPEISLHGHRFVFDLATAGFAAFAFDDGLGILLRNGAVRSATLEEFVGARCFSIAAPAVVVIVSGPQALMLARTIRQVQTSGTTTTTIPPRADPA